MILFIIALSPLFGEAVVVKRSESGDHKFTYYKEVHEDAVTWTLVRDEDGSVCYSHSLPKGNPKNQILSSGRSSMLVKRMIR